MKVNQKMGLPGWCHRGSLVLGAWVLAGLGGCGGGGGDAPAPAAAPEPAGSAVVAQGVCGSRPAASVPLAAEQYDEPLCVNEVPAAQYADPIKLSAINRLNEVRRLAGVGQLRQNAAIDVAAQGHSHYQSVTNEFDHFQDTALPRSPAFTAQYYYSTRGFPPQPEVVPGRLALAGYQNEIQVVENLSRVRPERNDGFTGANLIDALMAAPYHRVSLLTPQLADVGVGFEQNAQKYAYLTVNLARTTQTTQGAPHLQDKMLVWPVADAVDVPTEMAGEIPDPIPENCSRDAKNVPVCIPAGYAASVQVSSTYTQWLGGSSSFRIFENVTAETFKMYEAQSGALVDTKLVPYGAAQILLPRRALK